MNILALSSLLALIAPCLCAFAAQDRCPGASLTGSKIYTVSGHEIYHQSFSCSGPVGRPSATGTNITANAFSDHNLKRELSPFTLEGRNAAECKTKAPECQCGTSFTCQCQNVTADAPNPSDCQTLTNALAVVAQTSGQTFIVNPQSFELVTFQTCGYEFTNFQTTPMEYCWDELASSGSVVNQVCFQQKAGTAAACNANSGLWLSQALKVA